MDLGMMLKMTYMTHANFTWEEAKPYWDPATDRSAMDPILRAFMQRAVGFNKIVVFDSEEGARSDNPWHPTFGVVQGNKAYEVQFDGNPFALVNGKSKNFAQHPGSLAKLTCVYGCDA